MYFTYNDKDKIYELRNSVKSCVKRMKTPSLIYDSKTFELEEYGDVDEMDLRLLSFANRRMYSKEMVKTSSWDLDYLNKLINKEINFHDIDQGICTDFAVKFHTSYYRHPKAHLW